MSPTIHNISGQVSPPEIFSSSYGSGTKYSKCRGTEALCRCVLQKSYNRLRWIMAARIHLLTVLSPTRGECSSRDREAPATATAMAQRSASLTRQMLCKRQTKLHPSKYVGGGLETPVSFGKLGQQVVEWRKGPCRCCERAPCSLFVLTAQRKTSTAFKEL